jgi:hypothetical protein
MYCAICSYFGATTYLIQSTINGSLMDQDTISLLADQCNVIHSMCAASHFQQMLNLLGVLMRYLQEDESTLCLPQLPKCIIVNNK